MKKKVTRPLYHCKYGKDATGIESILNHITDIGANIQAIIPMHDRAYIIYATPREVEIEVPDPPPTMKTVEEINSEVAKRADDFLASCRPGARVEESAESPLEVVEVPLPAEEPEPA